MKALNKFILGLLFMSIVQMGFAQTVSYTASPSSTTNGDNDWLPGQGIIRISVAISGSNGYFTVTKADGGTFSSSGIMNLQVGTYESFGVVRFDAAIIAGQNTVSFQVDNFDNWDANTYPKEYYARYTSSVDGNVAWVGPITISREEINTSYCGDGSCNGNETANSCSEDCISQMANCDNLVNNFMTEYDIPGASFALAKNGKLVYHRAFGTANIAESEVMQSYHLFRIASISKPITSIAIMNMVENNQISLNDKVFGINGILANHSIISNANITDSRIYNITVQNLLEHSAGWNRNISCFPDPTNPYPYDFSGCDPIVAPLHITEVNGTTNPATEEDMIIFLLEKGLDFTPNTQYSYSNIGYLMLGEIIEIISGQSYENYVKNEILSPLGICDMHIGKNLISDKRKREVEYIGNGYNTLSCYNTGNYVPWEYGGFNLEAMDAHGGWIATTRDLVKLLVSIDGFSTKPDILNASTIATMTTPSSNNSYYAKGWSVNPSNNWWHKGALDGTATFFARTSGQYTWAILLNKRVIGTNSNQFWADFDDLPWNCISGTSSFPTHDLLDIPTSNSSNIAVSNITNNSLNISWQNGNGNGRILVAKENGSINNFPLDGVNYSGNTNYSLGSNIGNETFVMYSGIANNVTINNLQPNTSYSFQVFEYNQSSNTGYNKLYKLCGNNEIQVNTLSIGCQEPTGLNEINLTANGVTLVWEAVPDAIGYELAGKKQGTTTWKIFELAAPFKTVNGGLQPNTTYVWGVRAICLDGSSEWVGPVSFTTAPGKNSNYNEANDPFVAQDENTLSAQLFPNPAMDKVSIEYTQGFEQAKVSIKILDVLGKVVTQQTQDAQLGTNNTQIDISQLHSGLYFVLIDNGIEQTTEKLIVR